MNKGSVQLEKEFWIRFLRLARKPDPIIRKKR